jgi:hypothetical protein
VPIPVHRRERPDAELLESERKQLRAILGALHWLVAQLRFDMGFLLSTLQGESQTVGTLMKANQLVKKFKQCPDFSLTFKPMDLSDAGLMVVTDASLGNVTKQGGAEGTTFEKVFSQSAYFVLLGDRELMAGREGNFSVIDSRSHRLPRVCRSTYGAELQGTEEAFDVGLLCRGWLALLKGLPYVEAARDTIPLCVVTDAKDVYDKNTSDTPTYGSQKSLAFTVAWIRQVLGKPNTLLKWTSTENMFVDVGTKDMDHDHLHQILDSCRWSVSFNKEFVKQKQKKSRAAAVSERGKLLGDPLDETSAVYPYLAQLGSSPGWHQRNGTVINVAHNAKSFRVPTARFDPKKFSQRTTYARFDDPTGRSEWRILEEEVNFGNLKNPQALIGSCAAILISIFRSFATKEEEFTEKAVNGKERVGM